MSRFLRVQGQNIVAGNDPVILKGVNLGGWLMMEGYILHAPNAAEQAFKKKFLSAAGERALKEFESEFRANFIRADDFRRIADIGFNCVRLPFNHRLVETAPDVYDHDGVKLLDRTVGWAKECGLWVVLDLHGACGAQNHDWHSDSLGTADLWTKKSCRDRTLALWKFLADRYRDEPAVAGYDLLNEPVLPDAGPLNDLYRQLIRTIRSVDKNHIIFLEGNRWAQDAACLERFDDDNLAVSVHYYGALEFTFNWVPHLAYPWETLHGRHDAGSIRGKLEEYQGLSRERGVPVFVGEFGVNNREGRYGEGLWVADALKAFEEFGFHWTYWTYKAVKNHVFPDGLFSYYDNPAWVNRQGPLSGWDTYAELWPEKKEEIIRSWRTENFRENEEIVKILKRACR